MDTVLWWAIGIIVVVIALAVLVPELYSRRKRKKERRLGHRAKRRIKL